MSGIFTIPEFKNRGIIKVAPDALVYFNGVLGERMVAPVASKDQTIDFRDGITSVSIQSTIDPPGQSVATIQITTPIYDEKSKYWVQFNDPDSKKTKRLPYFIPMMEVKIYMKGRFLSDGNPKYYPSFWGLINNVEENYSGGLYTITLMCVDMLHWWHWSTVNILPTVEANAAAGGKSLTVYQTIFKEDNPFTILFKLTEDMGQDIIVTPSWLAQLTSQSQSYPKDALNKAYTRMNEYWQKRFANVGSLLKMYGIEGKEILISNLGTRDKPQYRTIQIDPLKKRDYLQTQDPSKKREASQTQAKNVYGIDQDFIKNYYLENFPVFNDFDKMGNLSQSEYMTKLEIASTLKERIDYEFFQDVNGNFIFKPPFYNMNVKYTMPYVVKPQDIISSSFQTESDGIVTMLQIRTPFTWFLKDTHAYPTGVGFHIDIDLASKYGVRFKEQSITWIGSPEGANNVAMGYMALINAKCFTGSLTIPGRPELRLGYPIYIDHRDTYNYVKGINHSFDYGGTFTTTLSLEAERSKQYKYDKEGGVYKDYIYFYQGPNTDPTQGVTPTWEEEDNKLLAATKNYGINQGRYTLVPRLDAKVTRNLKGGQQVFTPESLKAMTPNSVPFTDEEGYKVIGAFRYGRGQPNSFEQIRSTIDDVAGYQRESTTMRLLEKQQKIQKTVPVRDDKGSNVSTWTYEGLILGALNDFIIDKGEQTTTQHEALQSEVSKTQRILNANAGGGSNNPGTKSVNGQNTSDPVVIEQNLNQNSTLA